MVVEGGRTMASSPSPPLRLLLYLPPGILGEQGRADSVSKLSQILRSCPSCRGLLVLSRERDRHGSTGSPGTSPRSSLTVPSSGSWYCAKCGIHLVPQLESLSAVQNRLWTSPADRGRSPQGSHEDIKGSQTSLRKDPTSPLGSIPLSPGKILDEHYDEWERNMQASLSTMLQHMRSHFSLKSHQLKKLQVDLCQRERTLRVREESYADRSQRMQEGEDILRNKAERLQIYKDVMMSQLENKSRQLLKLHRKYHGNDSDDFEIKINVKPDDGFSLTNGNLNDFLSGKIDLPAHYKGVFAAQNGAKHANPGPVWRDSISQRHSGASSEQSQHSGAKKLPREKADLNRSWHYSTQNGSHRASNPKANTSLQFEPGTDMHSGNKSPDKAQNISPRPFISFVNRSPDGASEQRHTNHIVEPQTAKARHPELFGAKRYSRQYIKDLYTGHQSNSNSMQNSPHSTLTSASNVSQQMAAPPQQQPSQQQPVTMEPRQPGITRWSSGYMYGRPTAPPVANKTGSSQQVANTKYDQRKSPEFNTQTAVNTAPVTQYKHVSPRQSYTSHSSSQHSPKPAQSSPNQYNITYTSPQQYNVSTHRSPHNQYNILTIAEPQQTASQSASKPLQPRYQVTRQVSPSGAQFRNYNGVDAHLYQNSMDSSKSSHGSAPPPPYSPNGPTHSKRSPRRVTEI